MKHAVHQEPNPINITQHVPSTQRPQHTGTVYALMLRWFVRCDARQRALHRHITAANRHMHPMPRAPPPRMRGDAVA